MKRLRKRFRQAGGATRALVAGGAAGALSTWVMGKVTTLMYDREDRKARAREDRARGGRTSYEVAVQKAARLAGRRLTVRDRRRLGLALHWATGIGAGMLYGVMRPAIARVVPPLARGLAFGAAFWLVVDEIANAALRFTPGPGAFPWQAHARGLVGHWTYGAVADGALTALERA